MESENKASSWLDHAVFKAFPRLTLEMVLVVLILGFAVVSRFYDLGARVMSHDEVNHVVPSYDFSQGRGYIYDPVTHGPLQFHLIALSYFVFGDNDFTSRIPAAVCSILTVAFALFGFRRYLGRTGALIAGFMFLISPYMLFYGRYARDEAIYILFTIFFIWSLLRYLESGEKKFLYCISAAMALDFVTMESAYIYTAQALIFTALLFVEQITRRQWSIPKLKTNFLTGLGITIVLVLLALGGLMIGKPVAPVDEEAALAGPAGSFLSGLSPTVLGVALVGLIGAILFGAATLYFLVKGAGLATIRKERSFDLLVLMGFLVLPLLTAFPVRAAGFNPLDYSANGILHTALFLVPIVLITAGIGWWWNPRQALRNAAIFYVIFILFYTTFFTAGEGFFKGIIAALGYWLSQQAVNRGTQPLYYYALLQIPFYEFLPAAGALLAIYFGLRRKLWVSAPGKPFENALPQAAYETAPEVQPEDQAGEEGEAEIQPQALGSQGTGDVEPHKETGQQRPPPVLALFLFWSVTSLVAFSIAGEKMPWLTVNPDLGLILSAGWGLGLLVETAPWKKLCAHKPALMVAFLILFLAALGGALGSLLGSQPPFQGKDLAQLGSTSTFLFSIAALGASGYFLYRMMAGWKWFEISRALVLTVFVLLAAITIRTSFRASYINYDNAMEFLVYAHGATSSKDILQQVEEISFRTTGGKDIAVAYDNNALYPFWWYFRDYPNKAYFVTPTNSLRNSPIVLASSDNYAKVDAILGKAYYKFEYIRLWWPMEDYQHLTWERIAYALTDPSMRTALFDIWFNRDYTLYAQIKNVTNLTLANWVQNNRFSIYIRNDIVSQMWSYGVPAAEAPTVVDPYAEGQLTLQADLAVGGAGTSQVSFDGPRQIAFAPDGTFYVADSRSNRIQHLSQDGQILQAWGTSGDVQNGVAPGGTFNEPWGVAVGPDGSVYVADTFNYRIQKFTADGTFVSMWGYSGTDGSPDAFYGPRGLAVDAQGHLYVTDTGNKRVVVFDMDGTYVTQFGSAGVDAGQAPQSGARSGLDEPVGIALDAQGNVYVADTWNQRVQVFAPDAAGTTFTPTLQWSISGWNGQSLDNKPFIAVDSQQHVYVTDPEASRVLEFDDKGNFIRTWGQPGSGLDGIGLAAGIAVDAQGHVWVSDSQNNVLLRYTLPK